MPKGPQGQRVASAHASPLRGVALDACDFPTTIRT